MDLVSGNLQTTVPIYQLNSPVTNNLSAPHSHGFGLTQSHILPMQTGDRPSIARLGEYVSPLPLLCLH